MLILAEKRTDSPVVGRVWWILNYGQFEQFIFTGDPDKNFCSTVSLPHPHPYPFTHPNLFEDHLGLCDMAGGPVRAGGGREPPAAWSLWKTEDVGNCLTGETLEAGELPVSMR